MFKIYDGRHEFWQWDLDRKLIISDNTIDEVHFCNKTDDCSLVVEVYEENGLRLVNVPNILLQEAKVIRVYGYCGGCYTKKSMTFNVKERTKPADYVYTETEIKNFEELENHIKQVLAEFRSLIAAIPKFAIKPVDELPTENISETTVYLLKSGEDTGNLYKEYLYINGEWELLGSAEIDFDLSDYVKNTDIATVDKLGLIQPLKTYAFVVTERGFPMADNFLLAEYKTKSIAAFISKGTLENIKNDYVKRALTENDITLTEEEKTKALNWLGALANPNFNGSGLLYYAVSLGTWERRGVYQSDPAAGQIPIARTGGRITTNDPTDPKDCVNKQFLESVLGDKLDKPTSAPSGYGIYGTGYQNTNAIMWNAFPKSRNPDWIPMYDGNRCIHTSTPQEDNACANKKYVDDQIANAGGGGGTKLYQHDIHVNAQDITHTYFRIISNSSVPMFYESAEYSLQTEPNSTIICAHTSYDKIRFNPIAFYKHDQTVANGGYDVVITYGMPSAGNGTVALSAQKFVNYVMANNITEFTDTVTEL